MEDQLDDASGMYRSLSQVLTWIMTRDHLKVASAMADPEALICDDDIIPGVPSQIGAERRAHQWSAAEHLGVRVSEDVPTTSVGKLVRFSARGSSISWGGRKYHPDLNGIVCVPLEASDELKARGLVEITSDRELGECEPDRPQPMAEGLERFERCLDELLPAKRPPLVAPVLPADLPPAPILPQPTSTDMPESPPIEPLITFRRAMQELIERCTIQRVHATGCQWHLVETKPGGVPREQLTKRRAIGHLEFSDLEFARVRHTATGYPFNGDLQLRASDRVVWRRVLYCWSDVEREWPPVGSPEPAERTPHAPRPRRRKPVLRRQIADRMKADVLAGKITREVLASSAETALEAEYGHNRDTLRKARDLALSELSKATNSD